MRRLILLLFLAATAFAQTVIHSPDGRLAIAFQTVSNGQPAPAGGQLVYTVAFQGKPLIEPSALRLVLQGERPLGANVRIANATPSTVDETYRLVAGKASSVRNHYNAVHIGLEEPGDPGRKLEVEARAYDDAAAFRYVIPLQEFLREFRLSKEETEFRLSKDATTYALVLPNYRSMYESEFIKLPISAFSNQGGVGSSVLIGLPLLMEVPGVAWTAITEADMRDYAAMYLVNPSKSWSGHWFESQIAPRIEDPEISVSGALPHHSPWRVVMVASEPGKLIESNVITSLNPPPAIKDTSWIRAGKSAWDWWSGSVGADGKHAFTTENMKYYVDFAV